MGKNNSSSTRVAPVFDELLARDSQGFSWLARLLSVPTRPNGTPITAAVQGTLEVARWGDDEQALFPPVALLRWLVTHSAKMAPPKDFGTKSPSTRARRKALLAGDAKLRDEALALLASNPRRTRGWHIFEGPTYPDVYLQTEDVIIVIEGKRTEAGPTTSTSWMPNRHQMLRHLDCAWERRGDRKVYGFFIVEGAQDEVPAVWNQACEATIVDVNLASSLPHRSAEERTRLAECFLGATTWQALCRVFEISFDELPDLAE